MDKTTLGKAEPYKYYYRLIPKQPIEWFLSVDEKYNDWSKYIVKLDFQQNTMNLYAFGSSLPLFGPVDKPADAEFDIRVMFLNSIFKKRQRPEGSGFEFDVSINQLARFLVKGNLI